MPKELTLNFASLNANSIIKTNNKTTQSNYIRYLRSLNFQLLCLQETHANNSEKIDTLNLQFQCNQSIWTEHVGILSFSQEHQITLLDTQSIYESSRYQLCVITHTQQFYEPFYVLNIYAPASSAKQRRELFQKLVDMLEHLEQQSIIKYDRLIICGDFNYSNSRPQRSTSAQWRIFLENHFYNTMLLNEMDKIPTFQRTSEASQVWSVIDYIYTGDDFSHHISSNSITRLHHKWSDHNILHIEMKLGVSPVGPGLWRANPMYAKDKELRRILSSKLGSLACNLDKDEDKDANTKWEIIKEEAKQLIQKFGKQYVSWRTKTISLLQRKRNRILRSNSDLGTRKLLLENLDKTLGSLQQELAEIAALKAGVHWRENGEKSAGFLKRIHEKRNDQQYMGSIEESDLNQQQSTQQASTASDPARIRDIVKMYYTKLYSTEVIDNQKLDEFLDSIRFNETVSPEENEQLLEEITMEELLQQVKRSPRRSSPGNDGLGYPFLNILFRIPAIQPIILEVYNGALRDGKSPESWKEIRVRLLPKKGDLTKLKNWRPISLINCDAKILSRIINARLKPITKRIVQPYQSGFMESRFIGNNGLLVHLILQHARTHQHPGIGLLLDQEKAYDRVHPLYLVKVLEKFGFSVTIIENIFNLFFDNSIQVNVNGHFTSDIQQSRGLRQGDPLSPILFNLALEPLLLAIQQDENIKGYEYTSSTGAREEIKTLAYADDICVMLEKPSDYAMLKDKLDLYSSISNAKFNQEKTEAFSLNGKEDEIWKEFLEADHVGAYHSYKSIGAFRYLGYQMIYTAQQRGYVQQQLLGKIKTMINIYSQRQLSLRGRATVMNTLILSKLWYVLRVFLPTRCFFKELQQMIYRYVWKNKRPLVSFDQLCLPITEGGLGLINPSRQYLVLQKKALDSLFDSQTINSKDNILTRFTQSMLQEIKPNISLFTISFFVPEFRKHELIHPTGIINAWYQAFDHFNIQFHFTGVPLYTLMQLPLKYVLTNPPHYHWIHRRSDVTVSEILNYNAELQFLRLRFPDELSSPPRLLKQLLQEITEHHTIGILPHIRSLFFSDVDIVDVNDRSLEQQLTSSILWAKFNTRTFRNNNYTGAAAKKFPIPTSRIKLFWSAKMLLPARNLWYRVLSHKIPTGIACKMMKIREDDLCILCNSTQDNFEHFVAACPVKFAIWQHVMQHYYSTEEITTELILATLQRLERPSFISKESLLDYVSIISTIQYAIWLHYWNFSIDNAPFNPTTIKKSILSQIDTLLSPINMHLDS